MYRDAFIHLFQTPTGFYLYDVNSDQIVRISNEVYSYLDANSETEPSENVRDYLKFLYDNGLMKSNTVKKSEHPLSDVLGFCIRNKSTHLILQVTQRCNLRCSYCVYSGDYKNRQHTQKQMSFETASKAIDYHIEHSRDTKDLSVGFYGGEPLLRFDFIKKCVEYANERAEGRTLSYNMTTNGTLINRDMISYFYDHNVSIRISLDGPDYIHDKNRIYAGGDKGSFGTMMDNLLMVKQCFPDYYKKFVSFNTVLDPSNKFNCVSEFIVSSDLFDSTRFSSSTIDMRYSNKEIEYDDGFYGEYEYEVFKVFLKEAGMMRDLPVSGLLGAYFQEILTNREGKARSSESGLPTKSHRGGPCIPGVTRLFVSAEGKLLPCEKVSEMSEFTVMGDIDHGIDLEKARRILNVEQISPELCTHCWAYRYCTACIGDSDDLHSLVPPKEKGACSNILYSVEEQLKDYVVLRELNRNIEYRSVDSI